MSGAIPPLPEYAFMAWCLFKAQGQLYIYLNVNTRRCLSPGLQMWTLKLYELKFRVLIPERIKREAREKSHFCAQIQLLVVGARELFDEQINSNVVF
jgi:hypothetical protein